MPQFLIHHAFSLSDKLLQPNTRLSTEDEAEIADLRKRAEYGACEEVKAEKPQKAEKPEVATEDDISEVPGVGARTLEKLAALNVTTKSGLKTAVLAADEKVKEILGTNFDKVSAFFQA